MALSAGHFPSRGVTLTQNTIAEALQLVYHFARFSLLGFL